AALQTRHALSCCSDSPRPSRPRRGINGAQNHAFDFVLATDQKGPARTSSPTRSDRGRTRARPASLLATKLLHHTKRRLDTIDVVLHRAAADASRTHDRSAHFDGQAATLGSHPCY